MDETNIQGHIKVIEKSVHMSVDFCDYCESVKFSIFYDRGVLQIQKCRISDVEIHKWTRIQI